MLEKPARRGGNEEMAHFDNNLLFDNGGFC